MHFVFCCCSFGFIVAAEAVLLLVLRPELQIKMAKRTGSPLPSTATRPAQDACSYVGRAEEVERLKPCTGRRQGASPPMSLSTETEGILTWIPIHSGECYRRGVTLQSHLAVFPFDNAPARTRNRHLCTKGHLACCSRPSGGRGRRACSVTSIAPATHTGQEEETTTLSTHE